MNTITRASIMSLALVAASPMRTLAHSTALHSEIAKVAAEASPGLSAFLSDTVGIENAPFRFSPVLRFEGAGFTPIDNSPINWIREGGVHEDDVPRFLNHFYTVTRASKELTDLTWLRDKVTELAGAGPPLQSFAWAAMRATGAPNKNKNNPDSWQNARDYQEAALIAGSPVDREANLAHALLALGKVLHLNQDLSQPGHTRNDAHPDVIDKPWIEQYGKSHFKNRPDWFAPPPLERRGWNYWRLAGFKRLLDFWDRNLYTGKSSVPLDTDATGTSKLGLAEFSNGNFLSEDAVYVENAAATWSFPFPSRNTSTTYMQVRSRIHAANVDNDELDDGSIVPRVFLRKIADGRVVAHHSVMPYIMTMTLQSQSSFTWSYTEHAPHINSPKVLDDYHLILIPKAIEYSAGILDYFFRGQLSIAAVWDSVNSRYRIEIANKSGETFHDGTFLLYKEDSAGIRMPASWLTLNYSGSLPSGQCIQGEIAGPLTTTTKFIVVYKGTIGVTGDSANDPIDQDIAIAFKPFKLYPIGASLTEVDVAELGQASSLLDQATSLGSHIPGIYAWNCVAGNDWITAGDGGGISTSLRHIAVGPGSPHSTKNLEFSHHFYTYRYHAATGLGTVFNQGFMNTAHPNSEPYSANGCEGCVNQSSANAATRNPQGIFWHFGGPIDFWGLQTGPGIGQIDDINHYFIGYETSPVNGPLRSGAPVFQLMRLARFLPPASRVRIKDFSSLLKFIPSCNDCKDATTEPSWGGEFDVVEYYGDWVNYYPSQPNLSINGKVLHSGWSAVWFFDNGLDHPYYILEVYCRDAGGNRVPIWIGTKYFGSDATGEYTRDFDAHDCTMGEYLFCAKDIESIVLEAY